MTDQAVTDVRKLFQDARDGVLSTAHADMDGWPFASVVPYALTDDGDGLVFLSDISEHSKNLAAEPRATLFVADPQSREQPQAGPRHAMMVRARRLAPDEVEAHEARYFARFPGAERMREAHGFELWLLECQRIRWIAGFGSMGWIDRDAWMAARD